MATTNIAAAIRNFFAKNRRESALRLCFRQANGALAFFPLATLFEQLDTLKTLENAFVKVSAASGCS